MDFVQSVAPDVERFKSMRSTSISSSTGADCDLVTGRDPWCMESGILSRDQRYSESTTLENSLTQTPCDSGNIFPAIR